MNKSIAIVLALAAFVAVANATFGHRVSHQSYPSYSYQSSYPLYGYSHGPVYGQGYRAGVVPAYSSYQPYYQPYYGSYAYGPNYYPYAYSGKA